MEEWGLTLTISKVKISLHRYELLCCFRQGIFSSIDSGLDADVNWIKSFIVNLIVRHFHVFDKEVKQLFNWSPHQQMHSILLPKHSDVLLFHFSAIYGFESWDKVFLCIKSLQLLM